jgi:hypothetical protein
MVRMFRWIQVDGLQNAARWVEHADLETLFLHRMTSRFPALDAPFIASSSSSPLSPLEKWLLAQATLQASENGPQALLDCAAGVSYSKRPKVMRSALLAELPALSEVDSFTILRLARELNGSSIEVLEIRGALAQAMSVESL